MPKTYFDVSQCVSAAGPSTHGEFLVVAIATDARYDVYHMRSQPQCRRTGNTTGIPPLTALLPSSAAASLSQSFS